VNKAGNYTLKIYDVLGREVNILVNDYLNTGAYQVTFNAAQLAGGVYFYRLSGNGSAQVRKLFLLK